METLTCDRRALEQGAGRSARRRICAFSLGKCAESWDWLQRGGCGCQLRLRYAAALYANAQRNGVASAQPRLQGATGALPVERAGHGWAPASAENSASVGS